MTLTGPRMRSEGVRSYLRPAWAERALCTFLACGANNADKRELAYSCILGPVV